MTSTEKILTEKFEQSRIVCWRDKKSELHDEFAALNLPGVEKIEVRNNEFSILYRVLRAEPDTRFLIFTAGEEPPLEENWLLNLELTYDVFYADQDSLWLSELGLSYEYSQLTVDHSGFFVTQKRRAALKKILSGHDSMDAVRRKMLSVITGTDCRLDAILEQLLAELAADGDTKYKEIQACRLDGFLWKEVQRHYGYLSDAPSVKDFTFRLFQGCYFMTLDSECPKATRLNDEALVFLKRFKDSRKYGHSFEQCSGMVASALDLEADLMKRKLEMLGDLDFFKQIDIHILTELVTRVKARTISASDCSNIVRARRQTFWYDRLEHAYLAADAASQFLQTLSDTNLAVESLIDGFKCYTNQYFRLDQLYRKFIRHVMLSEQNDLLCDLQTVVENFYSNRYLLPLNNLWQEKLDAQSHWDVPGVPRQDRFFADNIQGVLDKGKKVFVIISDGLRYEIAEELRERLTVEDRYSADLDCMCSSLPSYTALGMAALLPHKSLTLQTADHGISVLADELSTDGSSARARVLAQNCARSTVVTAEEFQKMTKENGRALFRNHDVAYIYHNVIDMTGDDKMTEGNTCKAAQDAIEEIIAMVKRLAGYNATNIIVTADHGFIYQNRELSEDDFLDGVPAGLSVLKINRRFVFGKSLTPVDGLKKFTPTELGVQGDCEIQIAKSINRLRVKGSGSRYVHGGASLQEIVIPVLKIRKKREGDTTQVDVNIISGMSVITSGQIAVKCYQMQPVEGKILPRTLRAGLYSLSGELISDEHELVFDLTGSSTHDREMTFSLVLTHEAEKYNGQEIVLKLRERESGTTFYKDYQTRKYQLRRQLMDMDF